MPEDRMYSFCIVPYYILIYRFEQLVVAGIYKSIQTFMFYRSEKALRNSVVPTISLSAHRPCYFLVKVNRSVIFFEAYCIPLSEWKMKPLLIALFQHASSYAFSMVLRMVISSLNAQPTYFPVGKVQDCGQVVPLVTSRIYVISETHFFPSCKVSNCQVYCPRQGRRARNPLSPRIFFLAQISGPFPSSAMLYRNGNRTAFPFQFLLDTIAVLDSLLCPKRNRILFLVSLLLFPPFPNLCSQANDNTSFYWCSCTCTSIGWNRMEVSLCAFVLPFMEKRFPASELPKCSMPCCVRDSSGKPTANPVFTGERGLETDSPTPPQSGGTPKKIIVLTMRL